MVHRNYNYPTNVYKAICFYVASIKLLCTGKVYAKRLSDIVKTLNWDDDFQMLVSPNHIFDTPRDHRSLARLENVHVLSKSEAKIGDLNMQL